MGVQRHRTQGRRCGLPRDTVVVIAVRSSQRSIQVQSSTPLHGPKLASSDKAFRTATPLRSNQSNIHLGYRAQDKKVHY
jgi:hypothetical protein